MKFPSRLPFSLVRFWRRPQTFLVRLHPELARLEGGVAILQDVSGAVGEPGQGVPVAQVAEGGAVHRGQEGFGGLRFN